MNRPMLAPPQVKQQANLDDYFSQVVDDNPFISNRVSEPTAKGVDVPGIHHDAFAALTTYAARALNRELGTGIVLWGDAGIGKSHLLRRFCQWADDGHRAVYVFLHNIQASPEGLPQYLTRCVVSRLTLAKVRDLSRTPLYHLVEGAVTKALERSKRSRDEKATFREAELAYETLIGDLMTENQGRGHPDDRTIYLVLFQFFLAAYRARINPKRYDEATARLALRWLSGDLIDPDEAKTLALGPLARNGESGIQQDNQTAERILFVLSELARVKGQPVLLCFDQVENLEPEQFAALSRFLHSFLDTSRNLLVVTSGLQGSILGFLETGAMTNAAWDRISQHKILLSAIRPEEARQIIEARLETFHTPFLHHSEIKQKVTSDTLFPLGCNWLAGRLAGGVEFRPRDIVNWASDEWQAHQKGIESHTGPVWMMHWPALDRIPLPALPPFEEAVDAKVEKKLLEQIHRREMDPASLPPNADNLCGLVHALLRHCIGSPQSYTLRQIRRLQGAKGQRTSVDLIAEEQQQGGTRTFRTAIKFVTCGSARSNYYSLERLLSESDKHDHLLLVTDRRCGLPLGGKGQELLQSLQALGVTRFKHFDLVLSEIAELDALLAVVGDARSRDLEVESPRGTIRPLKEEDVTGSHHRRDRYRRHPLLCELLTESPEPITEPVRPSKIDEEQLAAFILHELALAMGTTTIHLAKRFVASQANGSSLESCQANIEKIALQLHQEGKLHATPQDNHYFCVYMGCL